MKGATQRKYALKFMVWKRNHLKALETIMILVVVRHCNKNTPNSFQAKMWLHYKSTFKIRHFHLSTFALLKHRENLVGFVFWTIHHLGDRYNRHIFLGVIEAWLYSEQNWSNSINLYFALFVLLLESVLPSSIPPLQEVAMREQAGEILMPLVAGKEDALKVLSVL